jgi:hypothetical protein
MVLVRCHPVRCLLGLGVGRTMIRRRAWSHKTIARRCTGSEPIRRVSDRGTEVERVME